MRAQQNTRNVAAGGARARAVRARGVRGAENCYTTPGTRAMAMRYRGFVRPPFHIAGTKKRGAMTATCAGVHEAHGTKMLRRTYEVQTCAIKPIRLRVALARAQRRRQLHGSAGVPRQQVCQHVRSRTKSRHSPLSTITTHRHNEWNTVWGKVCDKKRQCVEDVHSSPLPIGRVETGHSPHTPKKERGRQEVCRQCERGRVRYEAGA